MFIVNVITKKADARKKKRREMEFYAEMEEHRKQQLDREHILTRCDFEPLDIVGI
jgi:hypothetical protein